MLTTITSTRFAIFSRMSGSSFGYGNEPNSNEPRPMRPRCCCTSDTKNQQFCYYSTPFSPRRYICPSRNEKEVLTGQSLYILSSPQMTIKSSFNLDSLGGEMNDCIFSRLGFPISNSAFREADICTWSFALVSKPLPRNLITPSGFHLNLSALIHILFLTDRIRLLTSMIKNR